MSKRKFQQVNKKHNYIYTTNALMKRIRNNDKVHIEGSKDKKKLLLMGYFHGYKGCKRAVKYNGTAVKLPKGSHLSKGHKFNIEYKEIEYIYDTDLKLKSFFYPMVMQLETALKNYTIDAVVNDCDVYLDPLFERYLNSYQERHGKKRRRQFKKKVQLREKLDDAVLHNLNNSVMKHYIKSHNKQIPIWVIFELISLGNFGSFLQSLNKPVRHRIEELLNMTDKKHDPEYKRIYEHVFLLRPLRNSIAHNKIIFDCRFQGKDKPAKGLALQLAKDFDVKPTFLKFKSIVDYFVLIIYYQHRLGITKTQMKKEAKNLYNIIRSFKLYERHKTYTAAFCKDGNALLKIQHLQKFIQKVY